MAEKIVRPEGFRSDEAKQRAAEGRKRAADLRQRKINMTAPAAERRKPGQVWNRGMSIHNFCRECLGFEPDGAGGMAAAVASCTAKECHLWAWRNNELDENA